jgi:hypothetical protein
LCRQSRYALLSGYCVDPSYFEALVRHSASGTFLSSGDDGAVGAKLVPWAARVSFSQRGDGSFFIFMSQGLLKLSMLAFDTSSGSGVATWLPVKLNQASVLNAFASIQPFNATSFYLVPVDTRSIGTATRFKISTGSSFLGRDPKSADVVKGISNDTSRNQRYFEESDSSNSMSNLSDFGKKSFSWTTFDLQILSFRPALPSPSSSPRSPSPSASRSPAISPSPMRSPARSPAISRSPMRSPARSPATSRSPMRSPARSPTP